MLQWKENKITFSLSFWINENIFRFLEEITKNYLQCVLQK